MSNADARKMTSRVDGDLDSDLDCHCSDSVDAFRIRPSTQTCFLPPPSALATSFHHHSSSEQRATMSVRLSAISASVPRLLATHHNAPRLGSAKRTISTTSTSPAATGPGAGGTRPATGTSSRQVDGRPKERARNPYVRFDLFRL